MSDAPSGRRFSLFECTLTKMENESDAKKDGGISALTSLPNDKQVEMLKLIIDKLKSLIDK